MNADSIEHTADLFGSSSERLAPAPDARERTFWTALAVAALVHASLLIGVVLSKPRIIGDENGSPDSIAVSFISEADFLNETSVPTAADFPAAAATIAAPHPSPEAARPPEPKPQVKTEPAPETGAQPPDKPANESPLTIEKDNPDIFSLPDPATPAQRRSEPVPKKQSKETRTAKLDLSQPPNSGSAPSPPGGRSAVVQRPPGITRSGANDEFARGVIKALQKSVNLRPATGVREDVVVRILLNENSDVIDVKLLEGARDQSLNQEVIFTARQTTYPFPPPNSTQLDRTFVVTYVYR